MRVVRPHGDANRVNGPHDFACQGMWGAYYAEGARVRPPGDSPGPQMWRAGSCHSAQITMSCSTEARST
jgi:hypothetical protein